MDPTIQTLLIHYKHTQIGSRTFALILPVYSLTRKTPRATARVERAMFGPPLLIMRFLLGVIAVLGVAIADFVPDELTPSDIGASALSPIEPGPGSVNSLIAASSPSMDFLSEDPIETNPNPDESLTGSPPTSDDPLLLSISPPKSAARPKPTKPKCLWSFWPLCCTGESRKKKVHVTECFECMRLKIFNLSYWLYNYPSEVLQLKIHG